MTEPSGKIVATPMVARACGHAQEFQHYTIDKYRAQRLAKFQKTRCSECAAKLMEEERRAASTMVKKSEALKSLPAATQVTLTIQADGSWAGTLVANSTTVQGRGIVGAGPESVIAAMARQWLAETGARSA